MRVALTAVVLLTMTFAGCIGGFDETESKDGFGNTYAVLSFQGDLPDDDAPVIGATARDLLTKADALAAEWSGDARLFAAFGLELADEPQGRVFIGPVPDYEVYDADLGDGKAPAWDYLYVAPEKVTASSCEYLFVHVAHNGFAVSYTFDPSRADFNDDGRMDHWVCDEGTAADSQARWTVDSDEAAAALAVTDDRFTPSADGAEAVVWSLDVHFASSPLDEPAFDTVWLVSTFKELGATPLDYLLCFTAASDAAYDANCFDEDGVQTEGEGGGDDEAPEPLDPESGSGTISFGFVFSGAQTGTFSIAESGHSLLTVDYTVAANQVAAAYTIELLDVNGTVVDSAEHDNDGSAVTGSLEAALPVTGGWTVRVDGNAGTPEVGYSWCAAGYDPVNETAIDCA